MRPDHKRLPAFCDSRSLVQAGNFTKGGCQRSPNPTQWYERTEISVKLWWHYVRNSKRHIVVSTCGPRVSPGIATLASQATECFVGHHSTLCVPRNGIPGYAFHARPVPYPATPSDTAEPSPPIFWPCSLPSVGWPVPASGGRTCG
jgi:hypothetical protein